MTNYLRYPPLSVQWVSLANVYKVANKYVGLVYRNVYFTLLPGRRSNIVRNSMNDRGVVLRFILKNGNVLDESCI